MKVWAGYIFKVFHNCSPQQGLLDIRDTATEQLSLLLQVALQTGALVTPVPATVTRSLLTTNSLPHWDEHLFAEDTTIPSQPRFLPFIIDLTTSASKALHCLVLCLPCGYLTASSLSHIQASPHWNVSGFLKKCPLGGSCSQICAQGMRFFFFNLAM